MKRIALVFIFAIALAIPASSVLAHGQSVTVQPTGLPTGSIISPGSSITVIGDDLGDNIFVPVHLVSPDGAQLLLGTPSTDDDGAFKVDFLLPDTLTVGMYQIHAAGTEDA